MRRISLLQLLFVTHPFVPGARTIDGFLITKSSVHFVSPDRTLFDSTVPPDVSSSKQPTLLQPFLPAADPKWSCVGPVGEGTFVLRREGGPTKEELANENILQIVRIECSDLEVNTLVWKCLGYRFEEGDEWTASECFPNWRAKHPTPPDFIGMQRM